MTPRDRLPWIIGTLECPNCLMPVPGVWKLGDAFKCKICGSPLIEQTKVRELAP